MQGFFNGAKDDLTILRIHYTKTITFDRGFTQIQVDADEVAGHIFLQPHPAGHPIQRHNRRTLSTLQMHFDRNIRPPVPTTQTLVSTM